MSRARYLIKTMGGINRMIFRPEETIDPNTGADILQYKLAEMVLGYIQPTNAVDGVKGIVLRDTLGGDEAIAGYIMYHDEPLCNHDRLEYNGKWYELRQIEDWESSFMKFWKSYLIEVPNENQ